MARIFITGSSDGLGQMASKLLAAENHQVVLHTRNPACAAHAIKQVPGAEDVLCADRSSMEEIKVLARVVNALARFNAVNSLAPYIWTVLIKRPKRLVYISSQLHHWANVSLNDLLWKTRRWNGMQAYCDSKFHNVLLAFSVSRCWPETLSTAWSWVGLQQKWAVRVPRTILALHLGHKPGSPQEQPSQRG